MKITEVELIEVFVPYIAPIRDVGHSNWQHTLIRVRTDEGLEGLGEVWQPKASVEPLVETHIGADPMATPLEPLEPPFQAAYYDIVARALQVPVWRLIGDQVRDRVAVAYWSGHFEPEDTAREAASAAERGFTVHKLKARADDIVRQVERISEATAGGQYAVRVDPNCGFRHAATAVRLARQLEGFDIECFEDPLDKDDLAGHRLLRHKVDIRQALHLSEPRPLLRAIEAEAIDCCNFSGNVAAVRQAAGIAAAAGLPIWLQTSGLCLGVHAAFSVHLQATLRNELMPCDELPFVREDSLVGDTLQLRDGHLSVPEGPGLGVSLDESAVERYRTG